MMQPGQHDSVRAVFELREAAMAHGKALAAADRGATPADRDRLLHTKLDLEAKTSAAIDECSENAEEAAAEAQMESEGS